MNTGANLKYIITYESRSIEQRMTLAKISLHCIFNLERRNLFFIILSKLTILAMLYIQKRYISTNRHLLFSLKEGSSFFK